jgi:hypothetical protein
MIKAVENLVGGKKKDKIYVFLAGPIQGAPDWQNSVPEISGVEWINPKRDGLDGFNWDKQVDWETQAINMSDYVLFWIPKEVVSPQETEILSYLSGDVHQDMDEEKVKSLDEKFKDI